MVRLVPAAITPVELSDIQSVALEVLRSPSDLGEIFRRELTVYFSGENTYTFTSFMRATFACLSSIKTRHPKRRFVVLPRYSCPSFAHAVLASGLKIRYCDVDPNTLTIDEASFKKTLDKDVLAVIVSNLFGLSNPIDRIVKSCKDKNIFVLEGADYGIGSMFKGKRLGSYGDFTILNFQEGKAIPIGGGAIVERSGDAMKKWKDAKRNTTSAKSMLRMVAFSIFSKPLTYGLLVNLMKAMRVNRKNLSMEDTIRSTHSEFDFSFDPKETIGALSAFQAAMGLAILKRLNLDQKIRSNNAMRIERGLVNKNVRLIKRLTGLSEPHYIRYPVMIENRAKIIKNLELSGIEASPMYIEHGMNIKKSEFPGAYEISQKLLTLPCHPYVKPEDIKIIINTLNA